MRRNSVDLLQELPTQSGPLRLVPTPCLFQVRPCLRAEDNRHDVETLFFHRPAQPCSDLVPRLDLVWVGVVTGKALVQLAPMPVGEGD